MKAICKQCGVTVTDIACVEHQTAGITLVREQVAIPRQAPQTKRSRCPNPRDCGDPTCDGSCGY